MPAMTTTERVTLHLKTERRVRDRLLGSLRADGITMQEFFDDLMQILVNQPGRIDEIRAWSEEEDERQQAQARVS